MDEVLARVQDLAETQPPVVNTDQMVGCGASSTWITRSLAQGVIVRDGPAVFRIGGVRRKFETRAMAAVLSARASTLVSHRSAAYLHGFERVTEPVSIDITVPRHRRPRARPGIKVHESLAFDLAEPAIRDGIPVTGVARTILDCAPMFDKPVRLLDDALRRRIVTWDELWGCYFGHNARGRNVLPFKATLLERGGNTPPGGDFATTWISPGRSAWLASSATTRAAMTRPRRSAGIR